MRRSKPTLLQKNSSQKISTRSQKNFPKISHFLFWSIQFSFIFWFSKFWPLCTQIGQYSFGHFYQSISCHRFRLRTLSFSRTLNNSTLYYHFFKFQWAHTRAYDFHCTYDSLLAIIAQALTQKLFCLLILQTLSLLDN